MTAKQWAAVLASSPAPWGEVVTSKLVISTPRTSLATVKDPGDWTMCLQNLFVHCFTGNNLFIKAGVHAAGQLAVSLILHWHAFKP
jgi:hypothetical protein